MRGVLCIVAFRFIVGGFNLEIVGEIMTKYRKKPVVIDAFKWTGGHDQTEDPEWIIEAIEKGTVTIVRPDGCDGVEPYQMKIQTLEGTMTAQQGDYIIRGVQGEIYPCKADIFEQTYEKVDE